MHRQQQGPSTGGFPLSLNSSSPSPSKSVIVASSSVRTATPSSPALVGYCQLATHDYAHFIIVTSAPLDPQSAEASNGVKAAIRKSRTVGNVLESQILFAHARAGGGGGVHRISSRTPNYDQAQREGLVPALEQGLLCCTDPPIGLDIAQYCVNPVTLPFLYAQSFEGAPATKEMEVLLVARQFIIDKHLLGCASCQASIALAVVKRDHPKKHIFRIIGRMPSPGQS